MSEPRDRPRRPALAYLLSAGKIRARIDWLTIEKDLDIRRATREAWMNGTTHRLPLYEVLALCAYLHITPAECWDAVLHDKVPRWVHQYVKVV